MSRPRILVVDDSETIRESVASFLEHAGCDVVARESCAGALEACIAGGFDAAVVDHVLPDGTALDLLPKLRDAGALLPIVILTGHGSIDLAVRALHEGAAHFLTKPIELPALWTVLQRLNDGQRALRRERATRSRRTRRPIEPFLGTSDAIRRLEEEAHRVAGAESTVLVIGETGSGKGVLANWLHDHSPRAEETFVDLNCAGLTPSFLETELFGHEKGAFTGAVAAKPGLFELAHRGTLFLDEIGDVDPSVQPKLLKALEEKRFRRLGEVRDRTVDVRLIAATHQDLGRLVAERRFRSDLFYRVSAVPLEVPPLRARPEDIPPLARWVLEGVARQVGRPGLVLGDDALEALRAYPWPGNIRELRNVLERAAILAKGDLLGRADLRFTAAAPPAPASALPGPLTIVPLAENERRYLQQVLQAMGGRVEDAAKALGVPRSSLYERLRRHGITPGRD